MSLANFLTVLRVVLVPFFVWAFLMDTVEGNWAACAIFIAAAVTDYFDGFFARRYHQVSNFGKIFDPLADKILVASALILFGVYDLVPDWMVFVILIREAVVTAIRFEALNQGRALAAEKSGKLKTVLQLTAVIATLILVALRSTVPSEAEWEQFILLFPPLKTALQAFMDYGPYVLTLLATLASIASGADFLWKNREFLGERHPRETPTR